MLRHTIITLACLFLIVSASFAGDNPAVKPDNNAKTLSFESHTTIPKLTEERRTAPPSSLMNR